MNTSTIQREIPRLLRLPQVLELVPIGRSSLWAMAARGDFPKPLKLGARTSVWRESDIVSFIEAART